MKKRHSLLKVLMFMFSVFSITGCNIGNHGDDEPQWVDYVASTHIQSENWKTGNYLTDGVGVVTLDKVVDGDTAHFYCGSHLIAGRYNGINTPESTGAIEPFGKKASKHNKELLESAKTIVIETEPSNEVKGPEADSTGSRYLVWVWYSEREVENEDGSQLKLANLSLVQVGLSECKKASGSVYSDALYDADLQAQAFKLGMHCEGGIDDDFYYGDAIVTTLKDVVNSFDDPEKSMMGSFVCIEGIVVRKVGTYSDFYLQQSFEDEETGVVETYGTFVFSNYKNHTCVVVGNELRLVGTVAEYMGNYQITNMKYSILSKDVNNTKILSKNNVVEPVEISTDDFNKDTNVGMNTLVTLKGLTAYDGYGGTKEKNKSGEYYDSNAMTVYCIDKEGKEVQIRISNDASIYEVNVAEDGTQTIINNAGTGMKEKVCTFKYFIDMCSTYTMDITGLKGRYKSQTDETKIVIQLMLVQTEDIVWIKK